MGSVAVREEALGVVEHSRAPPNVSKDDERYRLVRRGGSGGFAADEEEGEGGDARQYQEGQDEHLEPVER